MYKIKTINGKACSYIYLSYFFSHIMYRVCMQWVKERSSEASAIIETNIQHHGNAKVKKNFKKAKKSHKIQIMYVL